MFFKYPISCFLYDCIQITHLSITIFSRPVGTELHFFKRVTKQRPIFPTFSLSLSYSLRFS